MALIPSDLARGRIKCPSCGAMTSGSYSFQGAVVCSNCCGLAQELMSKATSAAQDMLLLYAERLRQGLQDGTLVIGRKHKDPASIPLDLDNLKRALSSLPKS
jgi:hypothetical protein